MATITVNVDDEVYMRFRQFASEEKNGKKGFLGDAITEAMKKAVMESEVAAARQRLREKLRRGYNLGGLKEGFRREELYER